MLKSLSGLIVGFSVVLSAQTTQPRLLDMNQHAWFSYSGDHPLQGKWGVHIDGQWRRSDLGTEWQQYQIRPGVNYQVNRNLLLTLGYAYTHNFPYGDYPVSAAFPEHRIYQQVLVRQPKRSLTLSHRFRMEQRFIRYPQNGDRSWTYQNRFRYMLRAEFPITRTADDRQEWYIAAFDEVLIGLPPNYGARPWDHNRLFVGVGRSLGAPGNLEVGYMNQFLGQRNGRIFEFNNTLFVTFTSNIPLGKLFGK